MLERPMDVLQSFPVRKSRKQKTAFLDAASAYLQKLGYEVKTETGSFRSRNLIAGDPDQASYLITAHYDTCANMVVPNFITPCNFGIYLLYQLLLVVVMVGVMFGVNFLTMHLVEQDAVAPIAALIVLYVMIGLMMFGPANKHNANDNTSGVVTVLELARTLPEADRSKVCFVLFDLEEAGLIGSGSYRKKHKESIKKQVILNLDCVGDGDELLLFPNKQVKKDPALLSCLDAGCLDRNGKSVRVLHGFGFYPSDQAGFPKGIGVAALKRSKLFGLYMDKIHTVRDQTLEEENVMLLRDYLLKIVAGQPK